ncbi:MAG: mechanosensitive ion channel protein [Planctomycetota bacterium]|nr:MAG: mechanosensitive ion channel protein [Planctomycetota bacterium]
MNRLLQLAQAANGATRSPGGDLTPGTDRWQRNALDELYTLQFTRLDAQEWEYIAYYLGLRAIAILILLTIAWTVSGWLSSLVRVALTRVKFDQTMTLFLARLVRWGVLLMVALACLSYFGIETTSFAAVIGAAGLAIGLAFQGTLSNFAAGAMLLVFRPYKVGDTVNVAGHTGTVDEIELFTTTIDTADRRRIIVPNSSIYNTVIENLTHHPIRRMEVLVGVAYAADVDATRGVLERAVRSVPALVAAPPAEIALLDLGPSSVNWAVRAFARGEELAAAKQALIRAVKQELDQAGISIPPPQLEVHVSAPAAEPPAA